MKEIDKALNKLAEKQTNVFTLKDIKRLMKIASKHKIAPIRYASTDIITIKRGIFKGWKRPRKEAKPRKNGKEAFYVTIFVNKKIYCQP